jgi:hypothetical protein
MGEQYRDVIAEAAIDPWRPPRRAQAAHVVLADNREGAPEDNIFWAGNQVEA